MKMVEKYIYFPGKANGPYLNRKLLSKGALHTQLVIMLKHCFFYLFIKNEYYFVSNPSNYTIKSNFLFRYGPFAFPGK
jgi:hypothetical protein